MESYKLITPVLFFTSNNPVITKLTFEAIRRAQPPKLYVAVEGPKSDDPDHLEKLNLVREIATNVDWECEIKTRVTDKSGSATNPIASAVSWFFEYEDEGIILEHDSLPLPAFFQFVEELLERYRDDKRIMAISGWRPGDVIDIKQYSYFFSNHNSSLAWATWKRAWDLHDQPISKIESLCEKGYFDGLFNTISEAEYFASIFVNQDPLSWNYKWELTRRINSGLTIMPQCSLVSNIGSGGIYNKAFEANMSFPLRHPDFVMVDVIADRMGARKYSKVSAVKSLLLGILPHPIRKKMFEMAFKKQLAAHSKSLEKKSDGQNNDNRKGGNKNARATNTHWTVLKAIMDKNQMRFFSWANVSLTMCEFDIDAIYFVSWL